jgi:hypothetical protein
LYNEWPTITGSPLSFHLQPYNFITQLLPQYNMESLSKEGRINLALEVLRKDPKLSVRRAATIYEIPRTSLRHRRAGK